MDTIWPRKTRAVGALRCWPPTWLATGCGASLDGERNDRLVRQCSRGTDAGRSLRVDVADRTARNRRPDALPSGFRDSRFGIFRARHDALLYADGVRRVAALVSP